MDLYWQWIHIQAALLLASQYIYQESGSCASTDRCATEKITSHDSMQQLVAESL